VILEHSLPTTPKGIQQVFSRIHGVESRWKPDPFTVGKPAVDARTSLSSDAGRDSHHDLRTAYGTKVPVRTEETIDSATAAKGRPMRLKSATMFSTPTATWSFPVV